MKILGLDIGTTTVSAVVVEDGQVLTSLTRKNGSFLPTKNPWEKIQNPDFILGVSITAVGELLAQFPDIERIGVTGQMHGIVYLDENGIPVSPLYTWQDGRGDLPFEGGRSYAAYLSDLTGYSLSTGYGLVTHYYNLRNNLVPETAVRFCTIHDYVAMVLAGRTNPVTEASDAASFGMFNVEKGCFDTTALEKAGIDPAILPPLAPQSCIGTYQDRIPVYVAIGDNQASFLGATSNNLNCMLVNVGTGSQFSVYTEKYMACPGLETRPFPGGGYLLVGASLCGGRAYALLEQFFRQTVEMVLGVAPESCYGGMGNLLASNPKPADIPAVVPLFQGTRQNPGLRGSISGLSTENLTPLHLIWGMMEGMAGELYEMYGHYRNAGGVEVDLVGSGNGLRKNVHLQNCFCLMFGQELTMSECNEEAATGAAMFAASC